MKFRFLNAILIPFIHTNLQTNKTSMQNKLNLKANLNVCEEEKMLVLTRK